MPDQPPIRFDPSMEHIPQNEAEIQRALVDTLHSISETTLAHSGHATRSVHAKSHGVLRGKLTVLPGLPAHLAQGVFAKPAEYDVAIRLSTIPGDIVDDIVSTPRGMAIKMIGVEGPRLPGSENDTTQDFVLVNGPAFAAPNAEAFLGSLKTLAKTTRQGRRPEKKPLRRGPNHRNRAGSIRPQKPPGPDPRRPAADPHPGRDVLLPGPDPLRRLHRQDRRRPGLRQSDRADRPASRHVRKTHRAAPGGEQHFDTQDAEWEVRIQLCTDPNTMPIEDASVIWPEHQSPYLPVARIRAPMQNTWSPEAIAAIDQAMAFSPWHGIAAHRPLGSVMRARNSTYQSSANFRATHNSCPIHEPR